MMLKTMPQKNKDIPYLAERKERKNKKGPKKASTDVSKDVDIHYRKNAQSSSEGSKITHESSKCLLTLSQGESAWNPAGNAALSLFPTSESVVHEQPSEDEILINVMAESMRTASEESRTVDEIPQDEAGEGSAEKSEDEYTWGKVQRNLSSPEPNENRKISDANNNSGLQPSENLKVTAVKLKNRRGPNSNIEKYKKDDEGRSEILLKNETASEDTELVPPVPPSYIDKFGRIDGLETKRLFMGKGGRLKHQKYLEQQHLQRTNVSNEPQRSSENSSRRTKETTNASESYASSHGCVQPPGQTRNVSEEAHSLFQDPAPPKKLLTSGSEETPDSSQHLAQASMQFTTSRRELPVNSQDFVQPTKQFATEELSNSSQDSIRPLREATNESGECQALSQNKCSQLPSFSETLARPTRHSTNVSEERRDYSHQDCGSHMRQVTKAPEKIPSSFHRGSTNTLRPIVSGTNSDHYQRVTNVQRSSTSGQPVSRSRDYDGNAGDRMSNEYMRDANHRNDRDSKRSYRGSNRLPKGSGNTRDFQRDSKNEQNSRRHDEEYNRDIQRKPIYNNMSCKHGGESVKNNNNNDYRAIRDNGKIEYSSVQESNIPAVVRMEEPPTRTDDVTVEECQQKFKEVVIQSESKEIHKVDSNIDAGNVPHISNFNSRYTVHSQDQNSPIEVISIPPAIITSMNHGPVAPTSRYGENNDAAYRKPELQYPSLRFVSTSGFQSMERPVKLSCANCSPIAPLEERHANLRINDPLLYKLLVQKQDRNPPSINQTSINQKTHGGCTNCGYNVELPKNPTEMANSSVTRCITDEDSRAQFHLWHRIHPPPISHQLYSHPLSVQTTNMPPAVTNIPQSEPFGMSHTEAMHMPPAVTNISQSEPFGVSHREAMHMPPAVTNISQSEPFGVSHREAMHMPPSEPLNMANSEVMHMPHSDAMHIAHSEILNTPHSKVMTTPDSEAMNLRHSEATNIPHSNPMNIPHSNPMNILHSNPMNIRHSEDMNIPHSESTDIPHLEPVENNYGNLRTSTNRYDGNITYVTYVNPADVFSHNYPTSHVYQNRQSIINMQHLGDEYSQHFSSGHEHVPPVPRSQIQFERNGTTYYDVYNHPGQSIHQPIQYVSHIPSPQMQFSSETGHRGNFYNHPKTIMKTDQVFQSTNYGGPGHNYSSIPGRGRGWLRMHNKK